MIVNLMDVVSRESVRLYCEKAKKTGKKVGFTSGVYDLFHFYHLTYFDRCMAELGDDGVLIVGVDSDKLVRENKGDSRPIFNEYHRLRILDSLKYVSMSFIMHSLDDFKKMVDISVPDFIFKNEDFIDVDVYSNGSELVIIPDVKEIQSTSAFIEKIRAI